MNKTVVIGAGTMGNGIAHTFAMHGNRVILIDISNEALNKAMATISKNLDRMISKGTIDENKKQETLAQIQTSTSIDEQIADAHLVVEAASEQFHVKAEIFKKLDLVCKPETILATNTSSISITKIAAQTKRPDKVIGMHFMNPVPIMKLVEIINGYDTSRETTQTIVETAKTLNKVPIVVKDFPGFVANKILMPMINEAIITLHEGVAGVEEIDQVMKLGMSHPMGPLQLADFIGLDVCLWILNVLHEGFGSPKYAPCPLLVNMVTAGHLGVKSGRGFYDYSHGGKVLIVSSYFKQ